MAKQTFCTLLVLCLAMASIALAKPPAKLKRDAGLSFGSASYHGPSHKYLPPAVGVSSLSYDLHGNGLSPSSGFDFASLDSDSYAQHHHGPSPVTHHATLQRPHHYISSSGGSSSGSLGHQTLPQRGIYSSYHHHHPSAHHVLQQRPHSVPKVETFIVQTTSHAPSSHGSGSGAASGHGYGYKYNSAGLSGGSSSFASLLGSHKLHSGGSSGGGYFVPSSGDFVTHSRPSYALSSHSQGHGHGHAGLTQHSLPLGGSSGGYHHYEVEQQLPVTVEQPVVESGYSYEPPSLSFGSGVSSKPLSSYEPSSLSFGSGVSSKPLSSYGVPLLPGYDHEHKVQDELPDHTPAYALGQKGLGHFSYTASKPHALHTDVLGLGLGLHHHQQQQQSQHEPTDHNELTADIGKTPFKPSAFLGAKHESSGGVGHGHGHGDDGLDYATPSTQYLQPSSSGGYDYQAPALLYGAPSHSGDSATPIFEPETTYLPPSTASVPQLSYGPPSSHSYHH